LRAAAQTFLPPGLEWTAAGFEECRQAFERGQDYLYVEQPLGKGLLAVHDDFGSQLFRRAIANHMGLGDEYNWREYPQITNIVRTVESLQNLPAEKTASSVEVESVA
jgi:hypothetical protein